ncbi:hypothetical protein PRIPAC_86236 [Pristionchus pacificus]|uniref:Uncharacterized protein n=1 Tax=Pristionchus pacificus TaxID=54126 RepID=A0A2A6BSL8_PRIPA|nr:hypothetical protein PRIPAC_86236 [Pristionchus pacificus]|eukprot:PDM68939.1 hypothetical protein PRIPAC_47241 [Pristionchus pacificus]
MFMMLNVAAVKALHEEAAQTFTSDFFDEHYGHEAKDREAELLIVEFSPKLAIMQKITIHADGSDMRSRKAVSPASGIVFML